MQPDEHTTPRSHSPTEGLEPDLELLRELVHGSMSAEFSTAADGKPATFPLTPFFDDDRDTIVLTSPVAYAGKARAIERDDRVSLLLHGERGEYLVTGVARVDDDVEANAAYVRQLNEREPATPKRVANEEKYDFIDSRLGSALVGWLGHRIVIEIDPVSMVHVGGPSSPARLDVWPEVEMYLAEAARYERAVCTVVGEDGYPVARPLASIRIIDGDALVEPAPDVPLADGQPACLLLHWHDDASVNFGQRVLRGRFRTDGTSTRFVPASSSTLRNDGIVDTVRFVLDGRRRTRAYFRKRADADRAAHPGTQDRSGGGTTPAGGETTPPGPRGVPVVGNTHQFIRDPSGFYAALPSYGDVVRYRIGWHTWTAILHPDDVERVLVGESHRFRRYNFEDLGFDFVPDGLFFTDGERWRRQRRLVQPAFAPAKVAAFSGEVVAQTNETVDGWTDGEVIDANRAFSELVLEVLTTTLFDLDLTERRDVVIEAGHALADRVDTRSLSAFLPAWVPTPRNRRFDRKMARFDDLVADLIEQRRREAVDRPDLLSTLLDSTGDDALTDATLIDDAPDDEALSDDKALSDDEALSDEELRAQLVTFLFAGHETTALVLTYASLLVSTHPEVRDRLEEELEAVCGDRDPTIEDVPHLTYTEQVIKETMRVYPPVYVLFREAREDVTIGDHLIPEGSKLAIPQLMVHRDERWWDDPEAFRPERWTDELLEELPEYAYFPFGGGPRHCVGMRFATMFLIVGLATIARRVSFDLESDPDPDLRLSATAAPAEPVELRVRKRRAS